MHYNKRTFDSNYTLPARESPQVQKRLIDFGFEPIVGSQEEADAMFNSEVDKWGKMVKALGLSIK